MSGLEQVQKPVRASKLIYSLLEMKVYGQEEKCMCCVSTIHGWLLAPLLIFHASQVRPITFSWEALTGLTS